MVKKICSIFYVLLFCLLVTYEGITLSAEEMPELSLYARSALLLDASNNRVLYEENGYQVMPMASTTKIMTCILAIESERLDEIVEVSAYAARMPKVHLGMRSGEKYKLEDLLYSLMLESHNDTAVAIAEHLGESVEGFAQKMNDKAKDLGCNDTNFVTPNGLDSKDSGNMHASTARDMAIIAAYAIKNEEFIKITNTRSYAFSDTEGKRSFQISNKNRFLDMMEGAIGIKTGFTNGAGYCFVGALENDGKTFISVVFGSGWPPNKNWKWEDTRTLMNFGEESYVEKDIFDADSYSDIPVPDGVETSVEVAVETAEISLLLSEYDEIEKKVVIEKTMNAPVEKGVQVGEECYYVNGEVYARVPIVTKARVEKFDMRYCMFRIWERFVV